MIVKEEIPAWNTDGWAPYVVVCRNGLLSHHDNLWMALKVVKGNPPGRKTVSKTISPFIWSDKCHRVKILTDSQASNQKWLGLWIKDLQGTGNKVRNWEKKENLREEAYERSRQRRLGAWRSLCLILIHPNQRKDQTARWTRWLISGCQPARVLSYSPAYVSVPWTECPWEKGWWLYMATTAWPSLHQVWPNDCHCWGPCLPAAQTNADMANTSGRPANFLEEDTWPWRREWFVLTAIDTHSTSVQAFLPCPMRVPAPHPMTYRAPNLLTCGLWKIKEGHKLFDIPPIKRWSLRFSLKLGGFFGQ